MDEFTRPFTAKEFDKAFREAGYPEIARQYCYDKWLEEFNSLMKYDIPQLDMSDMSKNLIELREECGWTTDTVREEAWKYVIEHGDVDIYIEQRDHGNSHEWATLFCKECENYDDKDRLNSDIYARTYFAHRELHKEDERLYFKDDSYICNIPGIKSDPEIKQAVRFLAKGKGELVEHYIECRIFDMCRKNINELFNEAMYYKDLCEHIMADGYDKETAKKHAFYLIDKIDNPVYNTVYKEAMRHGAAPDEADRLADCCDNHSVNDFFDLEWREFMKEFTEPWQREIYARQAIEHHEKSYGHDETYRKDIRKSLDLDK